MDADSKIQGVVDTLPGHVAERLLDAILLSKDDRVSLIGRLWKEPSSRTFAEVLIDVELDQELALTLARALKARCVARE